MKDIEMIQEINKLLKGELTPLTPPESFIQEPFRMGNMHQVTDNSISHTNSSDAGQAFSLNCVTKSKNEFIQAEENVFRSHYDLVSLYTQLKNNDKDKFIKKFKRDMRTALISAVDHGKDLIGSSYLRFDVPGFEDEFARLVEGGLVELRGYSNVGYY